MQIKPYEKNAKKHTDSQLKALAAIVKEVGWRQPVLVNQEGIIVAGHGRYLTWTEYGVEYSLKPVWVMDDKGKTVHGEPETKPLTKEQEKAYRLADNKLNESEWDKVLVLEELKGLSDPMFLLTGFDKDLLVSKDDKDDEIPGIPVDPQTEFGDLYELGAHRVLCGDATNQENMERLMDGKRANLWITDPPYNVDYEGKTADALTIENDAMTDSKFAGFLSESFLHAVTWLNPGGVFYVWHADSNGYVFRWALKEAGLTIRQCLIWSKNTMVLGRQDYQWQHEPCLYGWKDGAAHLWNNDRKQTTILNFDKPARSAEHPTMKPVELITYQMLNSSTAGDIVLDSFLGSGTTLVSAEKTGRTCYGMEIDPKYVDVIISRYVGYTGNNQLVKNGEPITWNTKS